MKRKPYWTVRAASSGALLPRPGGADTVKYWLDRVRRAAAWLAVISGAALILMGALAPWTQVVLFKNIDLNLPGIAFSTGGLCLGIAALVLLGARRMPLLCLAGAVLVLFWTVQARHDVPRRVKHQIIGAQMAFFPLNRLLDQVSYRATSMWEAGARRTISFSDPA